MKILATFVTLADDAVVQSLPIMAGLVLTLGVGCDVSGLDRVPRPGAPEAPSGLAVLAATPTSLELSWDASDAATQYELVRDSARDGAFSTLVYAGAARSATDMGLPVASTWFYRVRAVGLFGAGALSQPVVGTTTDPSDRTPPAPIDDLLVRTGQTQGELTASWTNPRDADFAGVAFRYRTDGTFPSELQDGQTLSSTTGTTAQMRWQGLDPELSYYVTGFAFDDAGNHALGVDAEGPARPRTEASGTIRRQATHQDFEQGEVIDARIVTHADAIILMSHPGALQPPVQLDLSDDVGSGAVMPHVLRTSSGAYRMYFAYELDGDTQLAAKESQDGLTGWSTTQDLGVGGLSATEPFAYPLGGRRVRLFYSQGAGSLSEGQSQLMVTDSSDGLNSWSSPEPVALGLPSSAGAFVHDAIDGRARLYFSSFTDPSWDVHVAVSNDGLQTWEQVRAIDTANPLHNRFWPKLVPLRTGDYWLFAAGRRVDRPTDTVSISYRRTPDGLANFGNAVGGGFMNDIRGFSLVALDDGSFRYYVGEHVGQGHRTVHRASPGNFAGYGTYVSKVFGNPNDDPDYQDLSWVADTPPGTKVSVQLRSGTSRTNLGLWQGPRDGVSAYETSPAVPADQHDGDRYIQYRVILETSNELLSPVVHEISLGLTLR